VGVARPTQSTPPRCYAAAVSPHQKARSPAHGWVSRKRACQPPKPEGAARNRSRAAGATGCLRARAGRSAWARRAGGSRGQRGAGAKGGRKREVFLFGGRWPKRARASASLVSEFMQGEIGTTTKQRWCGLSAASAAREPSGRRVNQGVN
jgi:hypothetical protein